MFVVSCSRKQRFAPYPSVGFEPTRPAILRSYLLQTWSMCSLLFLKSCMQKFNILVMSPLNLDFFLEFYLFHSYRIYFKISHHNNMTRNVNLQSRYFQNYLLCKLRIFLFYSKTLILHGFATSYDKYMFII
jgi:hypothetical protein